MDVLFAVVGDKRTASTRHRVLDVIPYLEEEGVRVDVVSLQRWRSRTPNPDVLAKVAFTLSLLWNSIGKDIVYVQKIPFPGLLVKLLQMASGTVVFDYDDALYSSPKWESENPTRTKRLSESLSESSAVITGNPNLTAYAQHYNETVTTLPTPVPKSEHPVRPADSQNGVTIGWIGHPANLRYLQQIEDEITAVLDAHESTTLTIISGEENPVQPFTDRLGEDVEYIEWELESEVQQLSEFDLMVRPMPDTEWIRGKGGYTSIIRCMALGIPVIASPIEPLLSMVSPGETILTASDGSEWIEQIDTLIEDEELREEMGRRARDEVGEQGYWTHQYASELYGILENIAK